MTSNAAAADGTELITDEDRYLFDLRGYLVLRAVLSSGDLEHVNGVIDAEAPPAPDPGESQTRIGGFLAWDPAMLALIDHPRVHPYLDEWLGVGYRLDHYYGITAATGSPLTPLHLGGAPYVPVTDYQFRDGTSRCGLTVVTWALTDHHDGGFACIPGSHKANLPPPNDYVHLRAGQDEAVVTVEMNAGDVLIFTEALTHGTAPWRAVWERRALLFKYTPGWMAWARRPEHPDVVLPRVGEAATERQRLMLEGAWSVDGAAMKPRGDSVV